MAEIKKLVDELTKELKHERDELRVKLHLAKLDVTSEWEKIEDQLDKLEGKARSLGSTTAEASKDVLAAATILGEEIRDGLKKIAKHF